jgi:hypothetical protein
MSENNGLKIAPSPYGSFIDFLYANMRLVAPPGQEAIVGEIPCYKGPNFIQSCYQLSPQELEEVNKTGVIWLSVLGQMWPPLRVDAWIPRHRPTDLIIFGDEFIHSGKVKILQYLDINLIILDSPLEETDFRWREIKGGGTNADGDPIDQYDLEFKVIRPAATGGGTELSPIQGGRYIFGEALEILGRLKDLEIFQPLKYIFPDLQDHTLVMVQKAPTEGKIITLGERGLN